LAEATDPANLPDEAYYSAWYFIPSFVENSWWNIFQWKQGYQTGPSSRTARELYWVSVSDSSDGDLRLGLHSRITPEGDWVSGQTNVLVRSQASVPIGRWFHLESRYRWDRGGNGRITTWLDGRQVWDVGGLTTEFGWDFWVWNRQWTVNNYGSGMDPAPFTIWIDDAAVATTRIGP
jgi:hypothetical protein